MQEGKDALADSSVCLFASLRFTRFESIRFSQASDNAFQVEFTGFLGSLLNEVCEFFQVQVIDVFALYLYDSCFVKFVNENSEHLSRFCEVKIFKVFGCCLYSRYVSPLVFWSWKLYYDLLFQLFNFLVSSCHKPSSVFIFDFSHAFERIEVVIGCGSVDSQFFRNIDGVDSVSCTILSHHVVVFV